MLSNRIYLPFIALFAGLFVFLSLFTQSANAAFFRPRLTPTPTPKSTPTPTQKPTPTSTPVVSPTPTPTTASTKLGGMNLDGYCNSIGRPGVTLSNNTWYCGNGTSAINMTAECQWQYNSTAVARQETAGNPYSWACYTSGGNPTPTPSTGPTATPRPTSQLTPTPTQISPTPTPQQATNYYMALGDSFAFGFHLVQYQQEVANHTYNPASFNDGYDAVFFRNLQGVIPGIQEINYSCPGETIVSFINGGCSNHTSSLPLHTDYPVSQSQLQTAINFINSHPGNVNTITIDIGVNEVINLANTCQAQSNPVQCYNNNTSATLNKIQQNYDTILNALQRAAPQARIIILQSPDPVYYDGTDNLVNGFNQIQRNEASSRGLRLADTYSIFTADNVCSYTNFCASPSDFHPTALGYNAMATQVRSASGY